MRRFLFLFSAVCILRPFVAGAMSAQSIQICPVTGSLLAVTLRTADLQYGTLEKYSSQRRDRMNRDASGNVWLTRGGEKIGALVGPDLDHLYRFPPDHGERMNGSDLDRGAMYRILSRNDTAYAAPRSVEAVGRLSRPIDSVWTANGLKPQVEHTLFLKLPQTMQPGSNYQIFFPDNVRIPPVSFLYAPQQQISSAIHVNQLGFLPDSAKKFVFLSQWAGSLGPIHFDGDAWFSLIDEMTGKVVYRGEVGIRRLLSDGEDAYGKNYNGTDVFVADFSQFKTPGRYHIFVEGVGCSTPFTLSNTIWQQPLYHVLRTLYHQRSNIRLSPPFTGFQRPGCIDAVGKKSVFSSGARLMDTGNGFLSGEDNFSALVEQATTIPLTSKQEILAYYDAGDRDTRIQHLLVVRNLLDLFELYPDYYSQLELNLPESSNLLPDIVDEALWTLDFFCFLQEDDGGVRGGVEATDHPYFAEPSWLERHQFLAYHPGIWSTYLFAASAGQASRVLAGLDPDRAREYEKRARAAMHRAEAMFRKDPEQPFQVTDARNFAAIQMYRLTGNPLWHTVFLETSVFANPVSRPPALYRYDQYDQADAAWTYVRAPESQTNPEVRKRCQDAIIACANSLLAAQEKTGFGWLKDPWRPPFAGAFTIPFTRDVLRAWILTQDRGYLDAVDLSMQTVLGANPLNISYVTGIGSRSVQHPYYPDARLLHQRPPAGITVLGPLHIDFIGDKKQALLRSYGSFCYPPLDTWPALETFVDVFWFTLMNEFSIEMQANQLYSFGFLAAEGSIKDKP